MFITLRPSKPKGKVDVHRPQKKRNELIGYILRDHGLLFLIL